MQLGFSTLFSCPRPSCPQLLLPNMKTLPVSIFVRIKDTFVRSIILKSKLEKIPVTTPVCSSPQEMLMIGSFLT